MSGCGHDAEAGKSAASACLAGSAATKGGAARRTAANAASGATLRMTDMLSPRGGAIKPVPVAIPAGRGPAEVERRP